MTDNDKKTCFVIAPIGEPESPTRKRSDQVLRHIIRPVVERLGYEAIRADEIDKPGIITSQVLNYVVEAHLVIADLTERNPNVFYELAIRHAISKPFIQMINKGESLPFDVAGTRTVFVDLQDLDSAEDAREQIRNQIESMEADSSELETPISVSLDLQRLRQSEDPEQRSLADFVPALSEVRSGLSNLGDVSSRLDAVMSAIHEQSFRASRQEHPIPLQHILHIAHGSNSPFGFVILLGSVRNVAPWLYDVGVEAQRAAIAGDPGRAREIFQELIRLLEFSSSILPRSTVSMAIADDLNNLFERMVQYYGSATTQPGIPTGGYGYGGYKATPSDADDLPWE